MKPEIEKVVSQLLEGGSDSDVDQIARRLREIRVSSRNLVWADMYDAAEYEGLSVDFPPRFLDRVRVRLMELENR
jgi:hypothetical protein